MEDKKLVQALIDLKIPSIVILAIFAILTYSLLKTIPPVESSKGIAGLICLAVTVFSGIYAFLEHLIKERFEAIIKIQHTAMENLSKTHTVYEDQQQRTMTGSQLSQTHDNYTEVNGSTETKT